RLAHLIPAPLPQPRRATARRQGANRDSLSRNPSTPNRTLGDRTLGDRTLGGPNPGWTEPWVDRTRGGPNPGWTEPWVDRTLGVRVHCAHPGCGLDARTPWVRSGRAHTLGAVWTRVDLSAVDNETPKAGPARDGARDHQPRTRSTRRLGVVRVFVDGARAR